MCVCIYILFEGCRALQSRISVWNSLGEGNDGQNVTLTTLHSVLQQLLQINIYSYCYYFIQILSICVLFSIKLFQTKLA